jgi:hypothetical protein
MALHETLYTTFSFTLPCGYVDETGTLHRDGIMSRATALDEVEPLYDPRVQANQAYFSILLLSRVITRLGAISPVPPSIVERLFSTDFSYLQDLYVRVNDLGTNLIVTRCPKCGAGFELDIGHAEEGSS